VVVRKSSVFCVHTFQLFATYFIVIYIVVFVVCPGTNKAQFKPLKRTRAGATDSIKKGKDFICSSRKCYFCFSVIFLKDRLPYRV